MFFLAIFVFLFIRHRNPLLILVFQSEPELHIIQGINYDSNDIFKCFIDFTSYISETFNSTTTDFILMICNLFLLKLIVNKFILYLQYLNNAQSLDKLY